MEDKNIKEDEHVWQTVKAKEVILPSNYEYFPSNLIVRFISKLALILCFLFVMIFGKIFFGYKTKNRKNFYKIKGGCYVVSNHIHPIDAFALAISFFPHRFYITSLKSNLGLPFGFGRIIRILGAIPLPETKDSTVRFMKESKEQIAQNHRIVFFPEGSLWPYKEYIRPFKKGAFRMALENKAPILPMVWTFHKPKGIRKILKRKNPCLRLNILEPYYLMTTGTKGEIIEKARNDVHKLMSDFFNENSEVKRETNPI